MLGIAFRLRARAQRLCGIHRDQEAQRAVAPPRKRHEEALKRTHLFKIVAQPQDQRVIKLIKIRVALHRALLRQRMVKTLGKRLREGAQRCRAKRTVARIDHQHRRLRQIPRVFAPGRVLLPQPEQFIQIHDAGGERPVLLRKHLALGHDFARRGDQAPAIKHEAAVVATQQVGIGVDRL